MSLPETIREHIRNADFVAAEDEWLIHVDESPEDVEFFVATARALRSAGQDELTKTLLRLLEDEYDARKLWQPALRLVLAVGNLYQRPAAFHGRVLSAVNGLYGKSPSLEDMLRISALSKPSDDLRTLRLQVQRLESLLALDVNSVVFMEGNGVGRITAINFNLDSYKVDFEGRPGMTIGFKAGAKMLQPLPEGHILRAKLDDPERLATLRDDQPSELLREVLQSYSEPVVAAEIRTALDGIVDKKAWPRWWAAARSHPQVLVTSDKRQRYHWAESSEHAEEAVLQAFEAGDTAQRLDIFSKNAKQNPDLARRMAETLSAAAEAATQPNPVLALEIWMALDRAGQTHEGATFAPARLVKEPNDPSALLNKATTKVVRETILNAVKAVREDWTEIYAGSLLAEKDVAAVNRIAGDLAEESPERLEAALDRVLSQPNRHPAAFLWAAKRASTDDDFRRKHAARLFRRLLDAIGRDEFTPYRATISPLIESGGTLPKLLADLPEESGTQARAAIERSALEDYLKQPLINALELRFPELRESDQETLYALRESIEKRGKEVRHLLEDEIPTNRTAIQEAAAMGDLRENFEYKSARQRHEYLSARVATLQRELHNAQPIDLDNLDTSTVRVGAVVSLEGPHGDREISILGPWESDPEQGLISYLSELGQSLLGRAIGERLQVGSDEHEIVAITPYQAP
jgi:transcription elongation GreA/GreB family factor